MDYGCSKPGCCQDIRRDRRYLSIEGANAFRIRAYREAAATLYATPRSVAEMVQKDEDLTTLDGIGKELSEKIKEIVRTGQNKFLQDLETRTPRELIKLLQIPGLGPRKVQVLYNELGITTFEQLAEAARAGKISALEGFGEKTEQKLLREVEKKSSAPQRFLRAEVEEQVSPLLEHMKSLKEVSRIEVAGSYRRKMETVGDLDIVVTAARPDGETGGLGRKIMQHFVEYGAVSEVVSQGDTRSTVLFRQDLQVDMRVVDDESYGAALFYFTGSKAHNIALRSEAVAHGWKINEYGVFEGENRIAGRSEEEIYALFKLPCIPPELREDRGEIQAARRGKLPHLITVEDLKGDLQMHTTASDGRNTLEEMTEAARRLGHQYIAITDHGPYLAMTNGLNAERLAARIDEIDALNETLKGHARAQKHRGRYPPGRHAGSAG